MKLQLRFAVVILALCALLYITASCTASLGEGSGSISFSNVQLQAIQINSVVSQ